MAIKIIIVDDHGIVRSGLRCLLERFRNFRVVAEGASGMEALQLVTQHHPDVVLMDVSMPELNGVDATRRIAQDHPEVKVIALSVHQRAHVVGQMLRAGASGYLLKSSDAEEVTRAIEAVQKGKTYLSPEIAGGVVADYVRRGGAKETIGPEDILTIREREVLQLVAEGKTSKDIAAALHVTPKTVESHRSHLMRKLGIGTVAELTKYAVREGLTPLE